MARPAERSARERTEDGVIFVVLLLTLVFLVFMISVPLWFSTLIRGITG